jgi:hypothetical protein
MKYTTKTDPLTAGLDWEAHPFRGSGEPLAQLVAERKDPLVHAATLELGDGGQRRRGAVGVSVVRAGKEYVPARTRELIHQLAAAADCGDRIAIRLAQGGQIGGDSRSAW